jgi:hypothetical protein
MIKGIGSLLWKSIRRAGLEDGVTAVLIINEFGKVLEEEFGEKIKNKIKILYFKKKVLYLSALSSVVIQEIRMNEIQLLKRVNKKFNKKIVERLNFFSR